MSIKSDVIARLDDDHAILLDTLNEVDTCKRVLEGYNLPVPCELALIVSMLTQETTRIAKIIEYVEGLK